MRGQGGRRGRRVPSTPLFCALTLILLAAPSAAHAAIRIDDAQVTESATSVHATFTVTRVTSLLDFAGAAGVAFKTVDESARAPADYEAATGRLDFPARPLGGTDSRNITITVKDDPLDEPTESFRVLISGSAEIGDAEGTGTILDDDTPPVVAVADAPSAAEGAEASFAVRLSSPSGGDVSVSYATADGTAAAPADYTARTGQVTIPAGGTVATVPVALLDDSTDEANETFELRISAPAAATLGDAAGVGTILDNDDPRSSATPTPPRPAPPPAKLPTTGSTTPQPSRMGIAKPRLRRPSTVLLTLSCPKALISCKGRVTLFSRPNRRSKIKALRKERRLGRRTFSLGGGNVKTLEVALRRTDRRLLQRSGRMGVRAYAIVEDGTGRTGVRTVNGTLIARLAHSGLRGPR